LNKNTFRTLEFDTIRELLLTYAGSAGGRLRVKGLHPSTESEAVREALRTTTEGRALLRSCGRQPYHDLPDVGATLQGARVAGLHLEPKALLDVASFIEGGREVASAVTAAPDAPKLSSLAAGIADLTPVAARIRRAILPSGEIADEASPRLSEIRRGLLRLKARLQSVMEAFLRGKDADRILQEKLVTTRNERYVLLLKAEHRGQLPGIIHGSSGSGASLFVEPMPAVELNNDIVSLADEEREEVLRILRSLTGEVSDRVSDLERSAEILSELDAVQAMALLALEMNAVEPVIDPKSEGLDLKEARHPLLMTSLAERLGVPRRSSLEGVPVSLKTGFGAPVLVISGPNTGGKTVALKTVGLLALMAQSGLHIPAAQGSVLPAFQRIYADIGDDQSIAASLSTFSAHLAQIVEMTRDLTLPALVLLDEVGAGTDPTEGGALGVAIVDHFRERGAMVVATTHHGLLKAYAQSTPGAECASFGYDPDTYEPTYRLALGVPGRSLALEMAERLGLPEGVVRGARSRLDLKEAQAEALLKELEDERARLEGEKNSLREGHKDLAQALKKLREEAGEADARRRSEAEAFLKELRKRGDEAARKMADAVHAAVQRVEASRQSAQKVASRARTEALAAIREVQEEIVRDPELGLAPPPEAGPPVKAGSRVRVTSLGVVGEVLSVTGLGQAEVAVSGKRLLVPLNELRGVAAPASPSPFPLRSVRSSVPAEINLVGLTVDEALPQVDKLLDDAALSERKEIRVIHGFGEGRLRRAVVSLLEGHPHVAAFRAGGQGEGGGGVTVVELKD
jgi:DNA mismatch repair protein MutS2